MDSSSQIFICILIDQRARIEDMYNYGNVACASVVFISCILLHTAIAGSIIYQKYYFAVSISKRAL